MTREQRGMWDSGIYRKGETPDKWRRDDEGRTTMFFADLHIQSDGSWCGNVIRCSGLTSNRRRQLTIFAMHGGGNNVRPDGAWTFGPFLTADEGMAYIDAWIAARRRPETWDLGLMPTGDHYHVDPREYSIPQPGGGK